MIFLSLVTSPTYSIRLTANLRPQIDSGDPGLSFGCLTYLLASIVIEIIAIFCENNPILRKYELIWTPVTSNLTWSENDLSIFCRTCHGLSNAVYRLSLSFLVFEFSGGAVIRPPPPAVRRWLRPPVVRGLRIVFTKKLTQNLCEAFPRNKGRQRRKTRKTKQNELHV